MCPNEIIELLDRGEEGLVAEEIMQMGREAGIDAVVNLILSLPELSRIHLMTIIGFRGRVDLETADIVNTYERRNPRGNAKLENKRLATSPPYYNNNRVLTSRLEANKQAQRRTLEQNAAGASLCA